MVLHALPVEEHLAEAPVCLRHASTVDLPTRVRAANPCARQSCSRCGKLNQSEAASAGLWIQHAMVTVAPTSHGHGYSSKAWSRLLTKLCVALEGLLLRVVHATAEVPLTRMVLGQHGSSLRPHNAEPHQHKTVTRESMQRSPIHSRGPLSVVGRLTPTRATRSRNLGWALAMTACKLECRAQADAHSTYTC